MHSHKRGGGGPPVKPLNGVFQLRAVLTTWQTRFRGPVDQINTFAVFGDWFYQCLPEGSDSRQFLDYFIATAHVSEEFIWNQRGLLPFGYEVGLPIVRGAQEFLDMKRET